MSTRWYPIYQRGNPQLRIFLPNFWMKLVKQEKISQPSNKVDFIISSEMTRYDVKNYLEKIYKVPIANVETRNILGKIRRNRFDPEEMVKEDDYKVAYVTLQPGHTFEFPDLKIVVSLMSISFILFSILTS